MNGSLLLLFRCTKKDDKGCVENYRSISLTCLIMKVFERCIQKELYAACAGLLDSRQHGFLSEKILHHLNGSFY